MIRTLADAAEVSERRQLVMDVKPMAVMLPRRRPANLDANPVNAVQAMAQGSRGPRSIRLTLTPAPATHQGRPVPGGPRKVAMAVMYTSNPNEVRATWR